MVRSWVANIFGEVKGGSLFTPKKCPQLVHTFIESRPDLFQGKVGGKIVGHDDIP